jgi:hypothetical protein
MTPDNLRDVLAEALHTAMCCDDPEKIAVDGFVEAADALLPTVARLIADAETRGCVARARREAEAEGAYARGRRDGRAEQAAADRERVEALADEWESRAFNARACAASRLGLSDAEGLRAHADLMQRRADDLRAALDSEGDTP